MRVAHDVFIGLSLERFRPELFVDPSGMIAVLIGSHDLDLYPDQPSRTGPYAYTIDVIDFSSDKVLTSDPIEFESS